MAEKIILEDSLGVKPDKKLKTQENSQNIMVEAKHLNAWYGDFHDLKDISLAFEKNRITALIGPQVQGTMYDKDVPESEMVMGE